MQILSIVLSGGTLILSEMPDKFNWRKMLPHLTKLCRSLGYRQKDVSWYATEYVAWNVKENEPPVYKESSLSMKNAFNMALKGEPRLKAFYLYRYDERTGYTLLRPPL
jgi:hypothetical protein